jgi:quercetin dioxygenase-like cupin family protein
MPSDIIVIPRGTVHWWNGPEGDIAYLITRCAPDNVLPLEGS